MTLPPVPKLVTPQKQLQVDFYGKILYNEAVTPTGEKEKQENPMNYKIVADSSADLLTLDDVSFASVPLTIVTSEKQYTDDETLDVAAMLADLAAYKGKSGSACPNPDDWRNAFGDADGVFCIPITKNLSGSHSAALLAAKQYTEAHPDRRVYVVDTCSTGAEDRLIAEKLRDLIGAGLEFDAIVAEIEKYQQRTHLIFALESMQNLANNGRVSHVVAKIANMIGLRIIGKASSEGTLEITNKSRGEKRALSDIVSNMINSGYKGGRVYVHHCENPSSAEALREKLLEAFPLADVRLGQTRGLCSFYAERGGLMIGYESREK